MEKEAKIIAGVAVIGTSIYLIYRFRNLILAFIVSLMPT